MDQPKRADYAHFVDIRVKWGEMDSFGHVNNTVYYRYAEDGRIDYIHRVARVDTAASDEGPILADLGCSFLRQLTFPADVEIATRAYRIGNSSFKLNQALFRAGAEELFAVFDTTVVWFDYKAQTSMRVPEATREKIRDFEPVAPEE